MPLSTSAKCRNMWLHCTRQIPKRFSATSPVFKSLHGQALSSGASRFTRSHPPWQPKKFALPQRWLATQQVAEAPSRKTVRSGTILSHSPEETTAEEIVSRIKSEDLESHNSLLPPGATPLAVLLVTPSFSRWLSNDDFLRKAVDNVYLKTARNSGTGMEVKTLVAVVDRLPTPQGRARNLRSAIMVQGNEVHMDDHGHEGISYALMDSMCLGETTKDHAGSARDDIATNNPHTLGVTFKTMALSERENMSEPFARLYDLKITLANTVFQTGRVATLFSSAWRWKPGDKSFSPHEKTFHKHASLTWPVTSESYHKSFPSFINGSWQIHDATSFTAPLVPLTVPRAIHAGLGNIIRQTIGPDQKPQQASLELEQALISYFEAHGQTQTSIPVWALVMPPSMIRPYMSALEQRGLLTVENKVNVPKLASGRKLKAGMLFDSLLRSGGRLHRVQSGGGGWGKKAGLLSLDPTSYFEETSRQTSEFETSIGLPMSLHEELGVELKEVAKTGDYIQFLTMPLSIEQSSDPGGHTAGDHGDYARIAFGTIPSTMDVVPQEEVRPIPTGEKILEYDTQFGALTETGIGVRAVLSQVASSEEASSPQEEFLRTTLDVPFSRFSMFGDSRRVDSAAKPGLSKSEAKTESKSRRPSSQKVFDVRDKNFPPKRSIIRNVKVGDSINPIVNIHKYESDPTPGRMLRFIPARADNLKHERTSYAKGKSKRGITLGSVGALDSESASNHGTPTVRKRTVAEMNSKTAHGALESSVLEEHHLQRSNFDSNNDSGMLPVENEEHSVTAPTQERRPSRRTQNATSRVRTVQSERKLVQAVADDLENLMKGF